ncbi:hypothetical protein D3C85_922590 [compost metagenome]
MVEKGDIAGTTISPDSHNDCKILIASSNEGEIGLYLLLGAFQIGRKRQASQDTEGITRPSVETEDLSSTDTWALCSKTQMKARHTRFSSQLYDL